MQDVHVWPAEKMLQRRVDWLQVVKERESEGINGRSTGYPMAKGDHGHRDCGKNSEKTPITLIAVLDDSLLRRLILHLVCRRQVQAAFDLLGGLYLDNTPFIKNMRIVRIDTDRL